MKIIISAIFLFVSFSIYSQEIKNLDTNLYKINKNIFRLTAMVPFEDIGHIVPDIIFTGNYEHQLYKNVSLVGNVGIRMCNKSVGVYIADPVSSFHFTGIGEIRYYYALNKREKNLRPTINYSGGYVSLSQYVLTSPFAISSRNKQVTEKDAVQSQANLYFNIGYQRQYRKLYFNMFIGILITNETNNDANDLRYGSLPAGLTVGYVF